jgi:hypothetical protein
VSKNGARGGERNVDLYQELFKPLKPARLFQFFCRAFLLNKEKREENKFKNRGKRFLFLAA